MPNSLQRGTLVKEYGRFGLYSLYVMKDTYLLPAHRYQVVLHISSEKDIPLGSIDIDESTLPDFLNYLYEWLRGQRIQIQTGKQELAKQLQREPSDAELHEFLSDWIPRYELVETALQELEQQR